VTAAKSPNRSFFGNSDGLPTANDATNAHEVIIGRLIQPNASADIDLKIIR
jgi:hypothetical protein